MAPSKDTFSLHGVRKRFRYSERRQTYVYEDGSAIPESELAIISRELYRSTCVPLSPHAVLVRD